MDNIKFIAEIGSNHNRFWQRTTKLIRIAKKIGCYAVKFQLFNVDKLYRNANDRMTNKQNELPQPFIPAISKYCQDNDIKFGYTPFDDEAIELLKPYVDFFKISSYELLREDFIKSVYKTGVKLILSSGMLLTEELYDLYLNIIASDPDEVRPIDILHCVADYPAKPGDCNLDVIGQYKMLFSAFDNKIGWSDHTKQPGVIYQAVASVAEIIEFHLDLEDGQGNEYKHGHCWKPSEIAPVIENVNIMQLAKGSPIKKLSEGELKSLGNRADAVDGLRPIKQANE